MTKEKVFKIAKYLFSSGTSFVIDLALFTIFKNIKFSILLATICARILSSLYNYFVNSRVVFKKYTKTSLIKFYILVVVQMFASAFFVSTFDKIFSSVNTTIIKFFVDVVIFVVNYVIQNYVIFKNKK